VACNASFSGCIVLTIEDSSKIIIDFLFMVQGKTSVSYEPVYSDENAR
jgi:hypothetical protein